MKNRTEPDDPRPQGAPRRIPPSDAAEEAVERIASRRSIQLENGDVVVARVRVPLLNPNAHADAPWSYRVYIHPDRSGTQNFNAFPNAASHAEQLASRHASRVMYVEDSVPVMLANYRPGR